MQEHEVDLWTTKLFNDYLAAPLNSLLNAIGRPAENPAHPWENWITMEILVVLIIMVVFAILKSRLSAERPGKLQLLFETMYEFVAGQAHDAVEHGSKFVPFFGTLFIFILFMNLIGVIPGFESPTHDAGRSARARGQRVLLLSRRGFSGAGCRPIPGALRWTDAVRSRR